MLDLSISFSLDKCWRVYWIKLGSFFFPLIGIGAKKGLSVSINILSFGKNLNVSCNSTLFLKVIIPLAEKYALRSRSFFAKIFCYGFGSAIFIYITVNMSMVLGLLPIVGSPLPIMSYGGSSMLATMIGLGIVMSSKIYSREQIS